MCDQKKKKNGGDPDDDLDELSASDDSEPEEEPSSAPFDPELDEDDDDDDGEAELSAPAVGHRPFSLIGGDSAFSNRSHNIFDSLDSVAQLAASSLHRDAGTDRVFAQPLPPRPGRKTSQPAAICPTPAKKKGTPDYLLHPERWTHYSLEDVPESSDRSNSRAAHNFLSALQQRKDQQEKDQQEKDQQEKDQQEKDQQEKDQQESQSASSRDARQKMIFSRPGGASREQPADQPPAVRGKEKETRLSHLEDEDEEGADKQKAGGRRPDHSAEDTRGGASRPEEKKERGDEEEEEKIEEAFASFRKTKRKNYRKSSAGREDN